MNKFSTTKFFFRLVHYIFFYYKLMTIKRWLFKRSTPRHRTKCVNLNCLCLYFILNWLYLIKRHWKTNQALKMVDKQTKIENQRIVKLFPYSKNVVMTHCRVGNHYCHSIFIFIYIYTYSVCAGLIGRLHLFFLYFILQFSIFLVTTWTSI